MDYIKRLSYEGLGKVTFKSNKRVKSLQIGREVTCIIHIHAKITARIQALSHQVDTKWLLLD